MSLGPFNTNQRVREVMDLEDELVRVRKERDEARATCLELTTCDDALHLAELVARLTIQRDEALLREDTLRRELISHREKAQGNYWAWQGDNQDHLESLVAHCPVLIQAKDLQQITNDRDEALAKCDELERGIAGMHESVKVYELYRKGMEEAQAKCAEMRDWIAGLANQHEGYCPECNCAGEHLENCAVPRLIKLTESK